MPESILEGNDLISGSITMRRFRVKTEALRTLDDVLYVLRAVGVYVSGDALERMKVERPDLLMEEELRGHWPSSEWVPVVQPIPAPEPAAQSRARLITGIIDALHDNYIETRPDLTVNWEHVSTKDACRFVDAVCRLLKSESGKGNG